MKPQWFLLGGIFLLSTLIAASGLLADRQFVINTSPSVPPGLYLRSWSEPTVGSIVDFKIPRQAQAYVEARSGCDATAWYILKPIIAGPGDHLNTMGDWLVINGKRIAPIFTADSAGRKLPRWREDRVLDVREFFVFSGRIPNSFDSRYYGPIRREEITAVRIPLLTW